jgi:hypothetical protein
VDLFRVAPEGLVQCLGGDADLAEVVALRRFGRDELDARLVPAAHTRYRMRHSEKQAHMACRGVHCGSRGSVHESVVDTRCLRARDAATQRLRCSELTQHLTRRHGLRKHRLGVSLRLQRTQCSDRQ